MANLDALARALKGFVILHRWIFFTGLRLVKLYWPSGEETSEVFAELHSDSPGPRDPLVTLK